MYDGVLFYRALNNPTTNIPKAASVISAEAAAPVASFPSAFPVASSTNFGGGMNLMARLSSLAAKVNAIPTNADKGQKLNDPNVNQPKKSSGNGKGGPSVPIEPPVVKGTKAAKAGNKKAEAASFPAPPVPPASESAPNKPKPGALPTDAYREQIMDLIDRERVTIIHGETGCGKSSRIPVFILEEAEKKKKVRITNSFPLLSIYLCIFAVTDSIAR